jgi:hypothetical protein
VEDLESYRDQLPTVATFGRDSILEVTHDGESQRKRRGGSALTLREVRGPLFDSNVGTVWEAEASVAILEIALGGTKEIGGLRIHYGRTPQVPVTGVKVETLDDQGRWIEHWATGDDWAALTELVLTLIDDPQDGIQTLTFPPVRTEMVRIEAHGYDGESPRIAELEILEP